MLISKNILKGWQFIYFVLYLLILPLPSFAAVFNIPSGDEAALRMALMTAETNSENDIINLAAGTYDTATMTFMYSAGMGENFDLTLDGAGAGVTILDGSTSDQVLRIVTTGVMPNDSGVDIFIRDLTIRDGMGVFASDGNGGGFRFSATSADLTVQNCVFTNNTTNGFGGGLFSSTAGDVNLTNSTFTNNSNSASDGGGAFISNSGLVNITNSTFTDNSATRDGGGANVSAASDVVATDNIFTDNSAGCDGGGLLTEAQNVTLDVNEFDNNTADANGGGASVDADEDVNAMGNTFSNNSADGEGGRSLIVAENVTLDANEFASNIAAAYGGGLHASVANNAILTNHIFIDNSSDVNGGGADITADDATLTNNTFTLNSTLGDGGGLNLNINDATSANIFNNIIFNNSATGDGGDIFVDDDFNNNLIGSTVNLFNNDFSDFFSVCENTVGCTADINEGSEINTDPLFVNAAAGNVHLTANSPAIDLGSPTAPNLPATDFDGNPRIIGPAPDMGALEFTGPSSIDVTIVKSSDLSEVTEGSRVEITYTIILKNTGTQSATGITVQEPLPSGASLEEASLGCTENVPGTVICSVGTLGSAAEVTLTITISITPRVAEILNHAILRFLGAGGVTVEKNSNTVMITVEESGNGCSLASGPVHFETAAANFLILLIPGFVVGIRILRRRTKKNYS